MDLYIKQHVFTWGDKFSVYDNNGNERYHVQGEVFTFGKKLHVLNLNGYELAYIHEKVLSWLPKYYISRNGQDIAEVVKKFTFICSEYAVNGFGWVVKGDFFSHEYEIYSGNQCIVTVSKKWFTWGDAYQISIAPGVDEINVLAVVLIIDACLAAQNNG